ncbi:MAG: hypothetical protein PHX64_03545 [Candidatus Omnitrophica bacterium]|nr:hypothetical protein [Candidatus Omnitrophota bacterium]MDD5310807.1 hypothetical protein [Candidatus Omnitrophota bacterium]MDD5546808.1 hypothetical protein [Candidatus Omnitrophota bacterium]
MDKNKQQLVILGVVIAIFIAVTAMAVLKPRAKKPEEAKAAPAAAAPAQKPVFQKERMTSLFKSWGRDPFAIGGGPAEVGAGPASLSGIFCDPGKSYCIIDGKVAKVGDQVSGYKILEITKDTVTVKSGDEIRTLRIGH